MKRAPRSRQRHDLYAKYHDYDSEISDLLGECGLTAHDSREHRLKGFRTGADDFLTKPIDFGILDAAIKARILNSEKTFPPLASKAHLSRRETEVLRLLAEGNRVATIADTLSISYHTARQYKKTLYTKLRINNRAGATLEALKRNLISLTQTTASRDP